MLPVYYLIWRLCVIPARMSVSSQGRDWRPGDRLTVYQNRSLLGVDLSNAFVTCERPLLPDRLKARW
jgi:hypothetical protein